MSNNSEENGFEIGDCASLQLDSCRMAHFQHYFHQYYHETFRSHQGTEEIIELLMKYGWGSDWIDLGSGPSTLFWSLALSGIDSITCSDIAPEALHVLHKFVQSDEIPGCYREVLALLSRPLTHLADMRQRVHHYYAFDVMQPWPRFMANKQYDLITQFGTFGLAPSPEAYLQCFAHLLPYLKPEGRVLGANWIRSARLVVSEGGDNSYLSLDLIERAAKRFQLHVLHRNAVIVHDDDSYDAVLLWAMKKR